MDGEAEIRNRLTIRSPTPVMASNGDGTVDSPEDKRWLVLWVRWPLVHIEFLDVHLHESLRQPLLRPLISPTACIANRCVSSRKPLAFFLYAPLFQLPSPSLTFFLFFFSFSYCVCPFRPTVVLPLVNVQTVTLCGVGGCGHFSRLKS
jgi:hypothetical protein